MKPAKNISAFAVLVLTALSLIFLYLFIDRQFLNDNIRFYGLILDQNDSPVPDIIVHFDARSGYLFEGSGHQRTKSNRDGVFEIRDVVGTGLSINKMEKDGYEFNIDGVKDFDTYSRFGESKLWGEYTKDNPFLFRAWKVARNVYLKTSKANSTYGFKLNQLYSMDFTASDKRKVKKEGKHSLDMQVLFKRDESGAWELNLSVPDGGLIETDDLYMNLAPESGYEQSLVYSGTKDDHMIPKKFYIRSGGRLYGRLDVAIRPVMKIGSGLGIEHVLNLNGSRNLEAM